ncbi:MAG: hypothetical protein ACI4EH_12710 [Oliverpabstia sp.]
MEKDSKLIGQNMFMRAIIKADDGRDIVIMAMARFASHLNKREKSLGKCFWIIL